MGNPKEFESKIEADTSTPAELSCYQCGYDLRAHPRDGVCPECGGSVAESLRQAAIPRRPAWKESDPRWRRRILAGVWLLALMPLVEVLRRSDLASLVNVPCIAPFGPFTLADTYLCTGSVFHYIAFTVGMVLLFSQERSRRANRLDWTRRWGIICCYAVAILSAAILFFLPALVLVGISAVFISMPVVNQPRVTQLFINISTGYLRYGPYPRTITYCVQIVFASVTVLLACVPLWEALSSAGLKRSAKFLLGPLAFFALLNIAAAGLIAIDFSAVSGNGGFYELGSYFRPDLLIWSFAPNSTAVFSTPLKLVDFVVEGVKWSLVLVIAVRLSVAQWSGRRKKPGLP